MIARVSCVVARVLLVMVLQGRLLQCSLLMHCLNIVAMFWVVVRVPWMVARALLVKLLLCCCCRILNGCKGVAKMLLQYSGRLVSYC